MAEAVFKSPGKTIDHTPGSSLSIGDVVTGLGALIGVPAAAISAGAAGTLQVEGTFLFAKATSAVSFAVGDAVFWDTNTNLAVRLPNTTTSYLGVCVEAASATSATVRVKVLNGGNGVAYRSFYFADLGAGSDLSAVKLPALPVASKVVWLGINFRGSSSGVDNSNTCVVVLTDAAANSIVSKTYNTGTQPPNGTESLGTPDDTHGELAALESMLLSVTNGATANIPEFDIIVGEVLER